MIVPYSTDAPIYHFPWMTIVLIVANTVSFLLTGGGTHSEGWLLTYGRGLHPLEWIAYNFLHFGPLHLIGNMFFLWAFGIVVEGKLGWWKYLGLYLSIGIVGGFLIQTAMLWHSTDITIGRVEPAPSEGWLWNDNTLYAQDFMNDVGGIDDGEVMEDDDAKQPIGKDAKRAHRNGKRAKDEDVAVDESEESRPGAGGASLIIYGLLAVVLIWAPRNELHFFWMIGFRAGVAEIEYTWFCGFYIVIEVITAIYLATHGIREFGVTSEIGHATGALIGLALATLFVKKDWVDCENWDLFSVMAGRHSSAANVGEWQNYYSYSAKMGDRTKSLDELDQNSPGEPRRGKAKKKKKKLKPKLVELESLDDAFDEVENNDDDDVPEAELVEDDPKPSSSKSRKPDSGSRPDFRRQSPPASDAEHRNSTLKRQKARDAIEADTSEFGRETKPLPSKRWFSEPVAQIRQLISEGNLQQAFDEYRRVQVDDRSFLLPEEDLALLSTGLFKARAATEAVPLLEEYIERYSDRADRQRIKLAVLYVKFQRKPTAALKTLARVDRSSLPDDYLAIFRKAANTAQEMISAGVTDSSA